jgi:hypothetical protein
VSGSVYGNDLYFSWCCFPYATSTVKSALPTLYDVTAFPLSEPATNEYMRKYDLSYLFRLRGCVRIGRYVVVLYFAHIQMYVTCMSSREYI